MITVQTNRQLSGLVQDTCSEANRHLALTLLQVEQGVIPFSLSRYRLRVFLMITSHRIDECAPCIQKKPSMFLDKMFKSL